MKSEQVIHVAYAEDHISVRKGIIALLHASGNIIVDIEANNGREMLEQLLLATRLPDICIIDINMPQMDGFTLLTEIKKRWPGMKALIFTLYGNDSYINRMIQNGANGYLIKECLPEDIITAVNTIFNNGYYYSNVAGAEKFNAAFKDKSKPPHFTEAETEFLKYACSKLSLPQIAKELKTTVSSVKSTRDRVYNKINVNNRVSLALFAIQSGILPVEISNQNKKQ